MKIIIDERETTLYEKCQQILDANKEDYQDIHLSKRVIPLGDILVETDVDETISIIERKSLSDLLASIKDGRYEEQSHRLLWSSQIHPHNIVYLVEGMLSSLRNVQEKRTIYSAITSIQLFKGFSIMRTSSIHETAEFIIHYCNKVGKELAKGKRPANTMSISTTGESHELETVQQPQNYTNFVKKIKRDNITPENIGEIMLSQIPGISAITASAIMKHFSHFTRLLEEIHKDKEVLNGIKIETNGKSRKLGKGVIENIMRYLLRN
jgi:ERCC4-type nuclease